SPARRSRWGHRWSPLPRRTPPAVTGPWTATRRGTATGPRTTAQRRRIRGLLRRWWGPGPSPTARADPGGADAHGPAGRLLPRPPTGGGCPRSRPPGALLANAVWISRTFPPGAPTASAH